jgi:hypothetical protein
MSKHSLNAIISYLLDAIITSDEISLTSSLPEDVQEDLQFAAELRDVDLSGESRIRQKLRDQLQHQAALQASASHIRTTTNRPGQTQSRSTGAAFLSVGLGAAAVVMAALLIFFRPQKQSPVAGESSPAGAQETSAVEMVQLS